MQDSKQISNGVNKKVFSLSIITLSLVVLPIIANAQSIDVGSILTRITDILLTIFYGLIIIMFVYAGIKYLTARGEASKIAEANKALIWAVVGVAVGLLAPLASRLVSNLLFGSP